VKALLALLLKSDFRGHYISEACHCLDVTFSSADLGGLLNLLTGIRNHKLPSYLERKPTRFLIDRTSLEEVERSNDYKYTEIHDHIPRNLGCGMGRSPLRISALPSASKVDDQDTHSTLTPFGLSRGESESLISYLSRIAMLLISEDTAAMLTFSHTVQTRH